MKKKGFSYVEALIVILFIGLLFFFVLPKMFNTFDNSVPKKDDSFSVEVANIARVAKRQWIEDGNKRVVERLNQNETKNSSTK